MTGRRGSRLVVLASAVVVLMFLAASVAIGASSTPKEKADGETFSAQAVTVGPVGVTPVVYVATGANFPDALGAASASAVHGGPVLLVETNTIPAATAVELARLSPTLIYVAGGSDVVSDGVLNALKAYTPNVLRVEGRTRYETAVEVSKSAFPAAHQFTVYDTSNATTTLGASCSSYAQLAVPITVPGPGTIVVDANVNLRISHTAGSVSDFDVYVGTSPTDCASEIGDWGGDRTFVLMEAEPTGTYYPWVTMKKVMHVTGAGTHTFYINGRKASGAATGDLYFAYADATFIPDPGT